MQAIRKNPEEAHHSLKARLWTNKRGFWQTESCVDVCVAHMPLTSQLIAFFHISYEVGETT